MTKETTINDLALMIGKGFNGVDKRFERIEKKIEQDMATKSELRELSKKIDKIDVKLNNIVYRNEFEKLESKVKDIENVLAGAGIKI
jgi:predicted  nucleic acid-binding Zn-ribbon protein